MSEPQPRARISPLSHPLLAAALVPLSLLAGVGLVWLGHALRSPGLVGAALVVLFGATPAALAGAIRAFLVASFGLDRRARGLAPCEVVRGPLGSPYLVRGLLEGNPVRVFRDRIEVEASAPAALLGHEQLLAAAAGQLARWAGAEEAAARLLEVGVTHLSCDGARVRAWGRGLAAAEVAPAALALVRAPARVRARPRAQGSGCPYCHAALERDLRQPAVRCPGCDVRQHAECWREHGGCAVHGCRRGPAPERDRDSEGLRFVLPPLPRRAAAKGPRRRRARAPWGR